MNRRVSVKTALEAWGNQRPSQEGMNGHIPLPELYELLLQSVHNDKKAEILDHLAGCPSCLNELKEMNAAIEEAAVWDIALPKAAASEMEWPKKIPAEGGRYVIEIRRSLSTPAGGVITVKVTERYRDDLEGKTISVSDGGGRRLVSGQISDGELSQVIDDVDGIVLRFLVWLEK